ncbi:hypothetical protein BD414DRAFT_547217 [Trametes punicea]|nr:hypothetical protein BD414DRAFT_547217 [Trametes punicea]
MQQGQAGRDVTSPEALASVVEDVPEGNAARDVTVMDEPHKPSSGHADEVPKPILPQPAPLPLDPASGQASPLASAPPNPDTLSGLCLPSTSIAVHLPGRHLPIPTIPTPPDLPGPKRLSMRHIAIMYETNGDRMDCRVCRRVYALCSSPYLTADVPLPPLLSLIHARAGTIRYKSDNNARSRTSSTGSTQSGTTWRATTSASTPCPSRNWSTSPQTRSGSARSG